MTHSFERRHRGEVEHRLLDGGGRQAFMQAAFAGAPTIHADALERIAAARRGHLDRPGRMVDQPMPPERGGVAEHGAGAGVEHRLP
jgi:hypothetical protein